jgi:hypothetical protein
VRAPDARAAGLLLRCELALSRLVAWHAEEDPDTGPLEEARGVLLELDRYRADLTAAAAAATWTRDPSRDRRIGRGDDWAGDAWRCGETGAVQFTVVGGGPPPEPPAPLEETGHVAAARSLPCPRCGAATGEACSNGLGLSHDERITAVVRDRNREGRP